MKWPDGKHSMLLNKEKIVFLGILNQYFEHERASPLQLALGPEQCVIMALEQLIGHACLLCLFKNVQAVRSYYLKIFSFLFSAEMPYNLGFLVVYI